MGKKTGSTKKAMEQGAVVNMRLDENGYINEDFNSLLEDQHVDPNAHIHMQVFYLVKAEVKKLNLSDVRVRGVYKESQMGNLTLVKTEILACSE